MHAVFEWQEVLSKKSMGGKSVGQPPNQLVLDERVYSYISSVNSRGEIIVKHSDDEINIISRTGQGKQRWLNYQNPKENLSSKELVQLQLIRIITFML